MNGRHRRFRQQVPNIFGLDEYGIGFVLSDNIEICYDFQAYISNHPETREIRKKVRCTECGHSPPTNHLFKIFLVLPNPLQAAFEMREKNRCLRVIK